MSIPLITTKTLHIEERLASFAPRRTGQTGIIVKVTGISFETGEAEVVLVAVEASDLAEIVKFRQIDVTIDILGLQLNVASPILQLIA